MTTTLYIPKKQPINKPNDGFNILEDGTFATVPYQAATLLGCAPGLVDVLATGNGYIVYSIFDAEDEVNEAAMRTVAELTGISFDASNEDEVLCGPVLIIRA
jgi:hypothetical protein